MVGAVRVVRVEGLAGALLLAEQLMQHSPVVSPVLFRSAKIVRILSC